MEVANLWSGLARDVLSEVMKHLDIRTLLFMKLVCSEFKVISTRQILEESSIYGLTLTLPQKMILERFKTLKTTNVRTSTTGFGMKTTAVICSLEFPRSLIYVDEDVAETYIHTLKNFGLYSNDPEKSTVLIAHPSNQKHWKYTKNYENNQIKHRLILYVQTNKDRNKKFFYYLLTLNMESVVCDNKWGWMYPDGSYKHELFIHRTNSFNNLIHVPLRYSFVYRPIPVWNINLCENTNDIMNTFIRVITPLIEKKSTVSIVDTNKTLNYKDIRLSKKKQKIVRKIKMNNLQAENIVVLAGNDMDNNQIKSIINHVDPTKTKYNLEIICDRSGSYMWEYYKIQSFRPWQEHAKLHWTRYNKLGSNRLKRMITKSERYSDPADLCVFCCYKDYFQYNEDKRKELLNWWLCNKGEKSCNNFTELMQF